MSTRLNNKLTTVRDQVCSAYRNGATLREIGDLHGVSPGTVRNVLIEMGETLRSRGRRRKEEARDPRILSSATTVTDSEPNWSEDLPQPVESESYEGGKF